MRDLDGPEASGGWMLKVPSSPPGAVVSDTAVEAPGAGGLMAGRGPVGRLAGAGGGEEAQSSDNDEGVEEVKAWRGLGASRGRQKLGTWAGRRLGRTAVPGETATGVSTRALLESVTTGTGCAGAGMSVVEDVAAQVPVGVHCPTSGVKVVAVRTSTRAAGWRSLRRVSARGQLCPARTPCWLSALNPCRCSLLPWGRCPLG